MRSLILDGTYLPSHPIPSTRALASELGVSRSTAIKAYDLLYAEGLIEAGQGSYTRVSPSLACSARLGVRSGGQHDASPPPPSVATPPGHVDARESAIDPSIIDFTVGIPDTSLLDRRAWLSCVRKALECEGEALAHGDAMGQAALRQQISSYLMRTRGIDAPPERIMVTAGTMNSLSVASNALRQLGSCALMENPCHIWMHEALSSRGWRVDDLGAPQSKGVAFAVVTPSHHFPLGHVMGASERLALLDRAASEGFYIFEDDYDGEFRFRGAPLAPLATYDSSRVIFAGSFSKTLAPGLRLGYLVIPEQLVGPFRFSKMHLDMYSPGIEQAALAEFMAEGFFERHVARCKKAYGNRRRVLIGALEEAFGSKGAIHVMGTSTGLHATVSFGERFAPAGGFDECSLRLLEKAGVCSRCVSSQCFHDGQAYSRMLMLGYSHLPKERIVAGIATLRGFLMD